MNTATAFRRVVMRTEALAVARLRWPGLAVARGLLSAATECLVLRRCSSTCCAVLPLLPDFVAAPAAATPSSTPAGAPAPAPPARSRAVCLATLSSPALPASVALPGAWRMRLRACQMRLCRSRWVAVCLAGQPSRLCGELPLATAPTLHLAASQPAASRLHPGAQVAPSVPPHPLCAPDPESPFFICEQILSHPVFADLVEAASRRASQMNDAELTGACAGHGAVLALLRLRCRWAWRVVWDAAAEAAAQLRLPCSHAACPRRLHRLRAALSYS